MLCSKCAVALRVTDTRTMPEGLLRRRRCASCKARVVTIEISLDEFRDLKAKATELKLRFGK